MRNLILAVLFGLLSSFSPAVMAAPSQSSLCVITSKGEPVLNLCSKEEAELVVAATSKDAILSDIHSSLDFLIGMAYNDINFRCDNDYGHRKAPRSVITACFDKLDIQPKATVLKVLKDLNRLKECRDTQTHPEAMACMNRYVEGNKDLFPILDKAYEADAKYREGLKFLQEKGCSIKDAKLVCAGLNSWGVLAFFLLLFVGRTFPSTRVTCGVISMLIGVVICISDANAECTELSSYEEAHKAGDMYARMRFQVQASVALPLLKILVDRGASQSIKKFAIKTLNEKVWCNVGNDTKEIIGNVKKTKDFLKTTSQQP